jgi:uncharacterized protein (DUF1697 family)
VKSAVALLRGINVGSNRKVAMAHLRGLFEDAGCTSVATLIQSGNVVFSHPSRSTATLEKEFERRITRAVGFDVAVMIRTAAEWASLVDDVPFPARALPAVHVAVLKGRPARAGCNAFEAVTAPGERFAFGNRAVYLHLPKGVGTAKLPVALTKLGTPATVRNWRTVTKLLELTNQCRSLPATA